MTNIQLRLPESVLASLRKLAARENVTVDQLAASALAEKVAALLGTEYLEERAKRGSREKFLAALAKVPDVPPVPPDTPYEPKRKAKRKDVKRS